MDSTYNHKLRALRESLNLSLEALAEEARVSYRTALRAEQGYPLNPGSRQRLCRLFGKTSEELGLVPQRPRSRPSQQRQVQQDSSSALQVAARETLTAMRHLENEGINMNRSRRFFLQMLGAGAALVTIPKDLLQSSAPLTNGQSQITNISTATLENLATITQHYRSLQLAGLATEHGLRNHIALLQSALENTINDHYRSELWRLLAQSQLLARHSITKKEELGRARTWNEAAIASAQYSGDSLLVGAAIGHLGHLYLTWQHDPLAARKLLDQAQEFTGSHPLNGWFAMVGAAVAAEEKHRDACEASVARATEVVRSMPNTAEHTDLYYTDFNIAGTDAFAGNCFVKAGEPAKALERLHAIHLDTLAENRHASAFYDMACAYTAMNEFEAAQPYAFRSIDKALATDRLYIIPRFITLAGQIQKKDRHEPHAAAIAEYAHEALQQHI